MGVQIHPAEFQNNGLWFAEFTSQDSPARRFIKNIDSRLPQQRSRDAQALLPALGKFAVGPNPIEAIVMLLQSLHISEHATEGFQDLGIRMRVPGVQVTPNCRQAVAEALLGKPSNPLSYGCAGDAL